MSPQYQGNDELNMPTNLINNIEMHKINHNHFSFSFQATHFFIDLFNFVCFVTDSTLIFVFIAIMKTNLNFQKKL